VVYKVVRILHGMPTLQSCSVGARQYRPILTSPIVNGYVLPVVMKSLFQVTSSVPMDVGHLPLLARLSGTLCLRTCGIRMFLRTVTGSHWRRFYLRSTSVFSALEVFFYENVPYKSTFDIVDIDIWHTWVCQKIAATKCYYEILLR